MTTHSLSAGSAPQELGHGTLMPATPFLCFAERALIAAIQLHFLLADLGQTPTSAA